MHRLFVAIRLPEPIRDLLLDVMDEPSELRWVAEDNLHLTLRFIGEVERPAANDIANALARIHSPRFELSIAGAGTFDRRGAGTLWAGVAPRDPVAALAAKVERTCVAVGLEPEHRAFHPHITLARWKGRRARELERVLARAGTLACDPFPVAEFTLFESHLSRHGAHYREIAHFPLTGP
jgi:2'-5' RNA ligase